MALLGRLLERRRIIDNSYSISDSESLFRQACDANTVKSPNVDTPHNRSLGVLRDRNNLHIVYHKIYFKGPENSVDPVATSGNLLVCPTVKEGSDRDSQTIANVFVLKCEILMTCIITM